MTPTQARTTYFSAAVAVFALLTALSSTADAEACKVQDTTTNKSFQIECDTDPTKLSPDQWGRICKLPTPAGHQLLTAGQQPPSAARPCKDLNDTNCYSLVTLECR
jgi:hypothetical protein